jgi:hypothetical protein
MRKMHNVDLRNLLAAPSIIRAIISRRTRWLGNVARIRASRNSCRIVVGKSEVKRRLCRLRHRLEINIKMILREMA